jgi:hypothetical protein
MQIIIIDSAEALADEMIDEMMRDGVSYKRAILSCLHPIEVPSDAGELVEKVRDQHAQVDDQVCGEVFNLSRDEAAALITAHSRTVPREMLQEIFEQYPCYIPGKEPNAVKICIDAIAAKYGYHAE